MAIIVEEEKNNSPWLVVVVSLVLLAFLGFGAYYLFFKPVPGIEQIIVSPELQSISEVSKVKLDVASVTGSESYKSLLKRVNDPDLGVSGRENPFSPF